MSRIGKKPVPVPSNVTATVSGQTVTVKGAKGELSFTMPEEIKVEKTGPSLRACGPKAWPIPIRWRPTTPRRTAG